MSHNNKKMPGPLSFVDVHCHLHMISAPAEQVIEEAKLNHVHQIVNIGTEPSDWDQVITTCKSFDLKGAIGLHPGHAKLWSSKIQDRLKKHLEEEDCLIACGEIGLDYHYGVDNKALQLEVFRAQMELARLYCFPVEIHSRSAEEDTLEVLREYNSHVKGLLHCFTGTWGMAKKALDLGFDISFSGIVTFKNAMALKEVCKKVPLDRLHIETDAPYLTPHPYRGKPNAPHYLSNTAVEVARIHNIGVEELACSAQNNYRRLFKNRIRQ